MADSQSQQKPFLAGKKIIVAGAGIAGLSFTIAVAKQWSALTKHSGYALEPPALIIYERDTKPSIIDQDGYSLSIRSDAYSGGMQVLHKLGLLEAMLNASLNGTKDSNNNSGFVIWDKNWNELLKLKPKVSDPTLKVPAMRIARKALRQIMLDAALSPTTTGPNPVVTITWATSCTSATTTAPSADQQIQVKLSNGAADTCDLLIVADGANSALCAALRPQHAARSFAGVVCIAGRADFPTSTSTGNSDGTSGSSSVPAPLTRDWGTVIGVPGGVSLFASPLDAHSAIWSLSYLSTEPRPHPRALTSTGAEAGATTGPKTPFSADEAEALRREVKERGKGIAQPFAALVDATGPETFAIANPRDRMPFGHVGDVGRGDGEVEPVVFIGDSNHAMSSFAGNGANMALIDGWDLAVQLCKPGSSSSLRDALGAYDAASMPRSKAAIGMSHRTIAIAHAQGWILVVYVVLMRIAKFFLFTRG